MAEDKSGEQVKDDKKVAEDKTKTEDKSVDNQDKKIEERQYTETEQRALEQGWRPKEDFDGPEGMFIDAGEFLRRGELFGKIESQRKDLAELRKTLRTMQDHHSKVREAEYQRALETLKQQKLTALKEGEHEQVVAIDDQMDQVRDAIAEQKADAEREKIREQARSEQIDPRFSSWVDKNKWYAQDPELKAFADSIGIAHTKSNPGIDPVDVLKYVEKKVRTAYPDRFPRNPNRDRASAVEGGEGNRSTGNRQKSADDYEMTEAEDKVFRQLNRSDPKFWTKERYVKDLKTQQFTRVDQS